MMRTFMPVIQDNTVDWLMVVLNEAKGIGLVDTVPECRAVDDPENCLQLIPTFDDSKSACFLIVRGGGALVYRNGLPLLSMTVLHDRDEISFGPLPENRFYYSSENPGQIVSFHEGKTPVFCALSKTEIKEGMPAVRCECGLWFVQTPELQAYSYADTCIGCGRPTSMECVWKPQPVRKQCSFDMDRYRQEVYRRAQEVVSCKDRDISLAG